MASRGDSTDERIRKAKQWHQKFGNSEEHKFLNLVKKSRASTTAIFKLFDDVTSGNLRRGTRENCSRSAKKPRISCPPQLSPAAGNLDDDEDEHGHNEHYGEQSDVVGTPPDDTHCGGPPTNRGGGSTRNATGRENLDYSTMEVSSTVRKRSDGARDASGVTARTCARDGCKISKTNTPHRCEAVGCTNGVHHYCNAALTIFQGNPDVNFDDIDVLVCSAVCYQAIRDSTKPDLPEIPAAFADVPAANSTQ